MGIDKILTVDDVAGILRVKPITVREMFREKRLRAFKVGKGWRTTEKMLQEDIDSISRGEALPEVAAAAGKNASPVKKRKRVRDPQNTEDGTSDEQADDTQQLLF